MKINTINKFAGDAIALRRISLPSYDVNAIEIKRKHSQLRKKKVVSDSYKKILERYEMKLYM